MKPSYFTFAIVLFSSTGMLAVTIFAFYFLRVKTNLVAFKSDLFIFVLPTIFQASVVFYVLKSIVGLGDGAAIVGSAVSAAIGFLIGVSIGVMCLGS